MNISSLSSAANTVLSANTSTSSSDDIDQLEKQKAILQQQIQTENQSKDDAQTKQEKIKQLQQQIQQIELLIEQLQAKKFSQNQNLEPPANSSTGNNENQSNITNDLTVNSTGQNIDEHV